MIVQRGSYEGQHRDLDLGKSDGNIPLERCRRSLCSRTALKIDLIEIVCMGVDWIQLAKDSFHWCAVFNFRIDISAWLKGRVFLGHLSD